VSAVLPSRWRTRIRRVASLVTTVALVACTLGVPFPLADIAKDTTEAYPCMHCGCGCADADTCWRNCCCYSQQQKLAWAEKNGVKPPSFVAEAARAERIMIVLEQKKTGSCCATAKPTCCSKVRTCCQNAKPPSTQKSSSRSVVTFQALKCQGLGVHWVFAPVYVTADAVVQNLDLLPFETVAFFSPIYSSHPSEPSTPPPQMS